jgi:acyl-CoA thioesterase FadM
VNLLFRLIWLLIVSRFRRRCDPLGPVRTPFRVLPTDLDVLRHVNNGVYLSLLDLARTDLMIRSGLFDSVRRQSWYPVVTAESIRFRRPLTLFQRFQVETRVLGWDEKSIFLDQRFMRGDTVVAYALVTGRFLGPGGSIAPDQVLALAGIDPATRPPMPGWADRLAAAQDGLGQSADGSGDGSREVPHAGSRDGPHDGPPPPRPDHTGGTDDA